MSSMKNDIERQQFNGSEIEIDQSEMDREQVERDSYHPHTKRRTPSTHSTFFAAYL